MRIEQEVQWLQRKHTTL